ncbi:MAG: hypothetical protein KF836_00675 [Fimbriimonadaceae bacterium]|nr:hypothetical protein [Fimbriimonadaceae bacterium]
MWVQAKLTDFDEAKLPDFEKVKFLGFTYLFVGFAGICMMLLGFMYGVKYSEGRIFNLVLALFGAVPFCFAYFGFRHVNKGFELRSTSYDQFSCRELFERVTGKVSERHFRIILSYRARNSKDAEYLKYRILLSQPKETQQTALKVLDKNSDALSDLGEKILRRRDAAKKLIKWRWLVVVCAVIGFAPGLYSLLPGANSLYNQRWFSLLVGFGFYFSLFGGLALWSLVEYLCLRSERQAVNEAIEGFDLDGLEVLLNQKMLVNGVVAVIKKRKNRGDAGAMELYKQARKIQIRERGF